MSKIELPNGTYTALLTPFAEDLSVDEECLRKLVDFQVQNGVPAMVPCGTTGEAATLSTEEHKHVLEVVIEQAHSHAEKTLAIAGTGSNSTSEAIDLTIFAEKAGADGALLISPYYNKPTQAGIIEHFKAIASQTSLPIIVYNVPSRTSSNIEPATMLELAKVENIVACKEASGNLDQITEIIRKAPEGFKVFSGDDSLTYAVMALGGSGVICTTSNVAPKQCVELTNFLQAGDFPSAREQHLKLFDLFKVLFIETNPGPVKCAAEMVGLMSERLRLPLVPPSAANKEKIQKVLENLGFI
ncbi:MAG TPA: 4-hydroxy-tetrahydrodipicolinate synthase [Candidatus Lokiarchaeia archaeon]|nr:4-hydroxy-tetrahydrodipicolinate synthase [Candidatus Lokiarchaeia archaeon]